MCTSSPKADRVAVDDWRTIARFCDAVVTTVADVRTIRPSLLSQMVATKGAEWKCPVNGRLCESDSLID